MTIIVWTKTWEPLIMGTEHIFVTVPSKQEVSQSDRLVKVHETTCGWSHFGFVGNDLLRFGTNLCFQAEKEPMSSLWGSSVWSLDNTTSVACIFCDGFDPQKADKKGLGWKNNGLGIASCQIKGFPAHWWLCTNKRNFILKKGFTLTCLHTCLSWDFSTVKNDLVWGRLSIGGGSFIYVSFWFVISEHVAADRTAEKCSHFKRRGAQVQCRPHREPVDKRGDPVQREALNIFQRKSY